jgi:hypothetical protein
VLGDPINRLSRPQLDAESVSQTDQRRIAPVVGDAVAVNIASRNAASVSLTPGGGVYSLPPLPLLTTPRTITATATAATMPNAFQFVGDFGARGPALTGIASCQAMPSQ